MFLFVILFAFRINLTNQLYYEGKWLLSEQKGY